MFFFWFAANGKEMYQAKWCKTHVQSNLDCFATFSSPSGLFKVADNEVAKIHHDIFVQKNLPLN